MNVTTRLLTLACCLVGKAALAAEPATTFNCEGPFGRDGSDAKLAAKYGAANVTIEEDVKLDGEVVKVTILFPNDPARRLKIEWKDRKARRNPRVITIEHEHSTWSVAGVAIGTSLVDLERLNGRPFKLNYFEGDYGGDIFDWRGGRFDAPLPGGCLFGASIGIAETLPETVGKAMNAEIIENGALLSSGPGLRAAQPTVGQIFISFPKR
jgi:hypothetical protein